jgi:hypothetical protein
LSSLKFEKGIADNLDKTVFLTLWATSTRELVCRDVFGVGDRKRLLLRREGLFMTVSRLLFLSANADEWYAKRIKGESQDWEK